jgi:hypothetical protein
VPLWSYHIKENRGALNLVPTEASQCIGPQLSIHRTGDVATESMLLLGGGAEGMLLRRLLFPEK